MGKDKKGRSTKTKVKKKPSTSHKKLKELVEDRQLKILTETDKGSWLKHSLLLATDQRPIASSITECLRPFLG